MSNSVDIILSNSVCGSMYFWLSGFKCKRRTTTRFYSCFSYKRPTSYIKVSMCLFFKIKNISWACASYISYILRMPKIFAKSINHSIFVLFNDGQICSGDFATFFGLLIWTLLHFKNPKFVQLTYLRYFLVLETQRKR